MAVEPTVPKRIDPFLTIPLIASVLGGDEILIRPFSFVPFCRQCSTNVPWKLPLYLPDHFPVRAPAWAVAVCDAGALDDVAGAVLPVVVACPAL